MNYIKQLENDKKELIDEMTKNNAVLMDLYIYLNSPKFQGVDPRDGSLNNYVNINDVLDRIKPILKPVDKVE